MQHAHKRNAAAGNRPFNIKQAWMDARTKRDFIAAEQLGNNILKKREDPVVRLGLARLLVELGRGEQALDHWRHLSEQGAHRFEAGFNIARASIDEGTPHDIVIMNACPDGPASLHRNLSAVFREDDDSGPAEDMHHIAICGLSFCGSTLLDRLLGGLPGVRSIGESHWLIKTRRGQGYVLADFSSETMPVLVPCSVCRARCPVLSQRLRHRLAADHTRWYFRIARALGTRTLVSADKNLPKLVDNDPLLRFDALVVFKSPAQAWASTLDKLPRDRPSDFYAAECARYMEVWSKAYRSALEHFLPAGKVAFLNFDEFAEEPKYVLERLCRTLSLPFDPSVLQRVVPGHAIGGNGRAIAKLRMNGYKVEILPLPRLDIPLEHVRIIESHDAAMEIHSRLMSALRPAI